MLSIINLMNFAHIKRYNQFLRNNFIEIQRNQNCYAFTRHVYICNETNNPFDFFFRYTTKYERCKTFTYKYDTFYRFTKKKKNKVNSSFLVFYFFPRVNSGALSLSIAFSMFDPPQRSRDPLELWFLSWFRNPRSVAGNHLRPTKNPEAA